MEGFEQLSAANEQVLEDLYNTMSMQNWMRSNQSMQVIGANDSVEQNQYTFSGLSDVYEMFMLDVSGATEIPVTKLFGRSPAGMNSTGESDMMNYYDVLEGGQETDVRPLLDRLLPIMCVSEFGAIPDDLDFAFEPVRNPTEEERKTLSTQVTTAIGAMFNAGIISQQIALKELRDSSKQTGMWTNITDEDIDRADSDFGVGGEPPMPEGAGEQEADFSSSDRADKIVLSADKLTRDDEEEWITVNGTHIPLDENGGLSGEVGKKIATTSNESNSPTSNESKSPTSNAEKFFPKQSSNLGTGSHQGWQKEQNKYLQSKGVPPESADKLDSLIRSHTQGSNVDEDIKRLARDNPEAIKAAAEFELAAIERRSSEEVPMK
jgi:hypothetical protein